MGLPQVDVVVCVHVKMPGIWTLSDAELASLTPEEWKDIRG